MTRVKSTEIEEVELIFASIGRCGDSANHEMWHPSSPNPNSMSLDLAKYVVHDLFLGLLSIMTVPVNNLKHQ